MIKRSTRILFEVLLGLLALAVVLGGAVVWRLSQGPVPLGFLAADLEAALSDPERGIEVTIDKTVLLWSSESQRLDLQALGVRVIAPAVKQAAYLPTVSVELSPAALIQGVIAPEAIEVWGPQITLIRDTEGRFEFEPQDFEAEAAESPGETEMADFSALIPGILNELVAGTSQDRPLSFLKVVRARLGSFTIIDLAMAKTVRAPFSVIEVRRDHLGLAGQLTLGATAGGEWQKLDVSVLYRKSIQVIQLDARFFSLRPGALETLEPRFEVLSSLAIPLDGEVKVLLKPTGLVHNLEFELTGGTGLLTLPDYFPEPLVLFHVSIGGDWDRSQGRLQLRQSEIQLGKEGRGPKLTLEAVLSGDLEQASLNFSASVDHVGATELGDYWPIGVAEGGREWVVENITAGEASNATVTGTFEINGGDITTVELVALDGRYEYRDLTVQYFHPLPPVTGVSGHADFNAKTMTFHPGGGTVGTIAVSDADVALNGFDQPVESLNIAFNAQGPVHDILSLLDQEPLALISELGLDPAGTSGQADARVTITFPLLVDLEFEQVEISAQGRGENVGAAQAVLGHDIEQANFDLELTDLAMSLDGEAVLNGYPVQFVWDEAFAEVEGPSTRVDAHFARFDEVALAGFGLDLAPYVSGPMAVGLAIALDPQRSGTIEIAADLSQALLDLPFLYWQKPVGDPGRLSLKLGLVDETIAEIDSLQIVGPGFSVVGKADLAPSAFSQGEFDLSRLVFAGNDLHDVRIRLVDGGVRIAVGGGSFDVEPFMAAEPESSTLGEDGESVSFRIEAKGLERVYFAEDRYLEGVDLELERLHGDWRKFALEARLPEAFWVGPKPKPKPKPAAGQQKLGTGGVVDKTQFETPTPEPEPPTVVSEPIDDGERWVRLDYGPSPEGGYRVEASADDFGALLRATDIHDTVTGGRMRLSGGGEGPLPHNALAGDLEVENYMLVEAPVLAKVLTLASLTGILDTMSGEGIHFEKLTGSYRLQDDIVTTDLIRAYGAALGITLKGDLDTDRYEVNFGGTVVPAYTINSILGGIPLLGTILTGGEGEGILAFTYRIDGPVNDPEVSVNPLSVLAPGFLRGLFNGFGGIESEEGDAVTVYPSETGR